MAPPRSLSWSEQELWDAATHGDELHLTTRTQEERELRPDVIHDMCVSRDDGHSKGVRVKQGIITGPLDFEFATLKVPLILEGCTIRVGERMKHPYAVNLQRATGTWISFIDCVIEGPVLADQLRLTHSLNLSRAKVLGPIRLDGANIGGDLSLVGADLAGRLSVSDATITRNLDLRGAQFSDGTRPAAELHAEAIKVDGHVKMGPTDDKRVTALGDVYLTEARIGCGLDLSLGSVHGRLALDDATISSNLDLRGAQLTSRHGVALSAERIEVGGSVFLARVGDARFVAEGSLRLDDAEVGHDLSLVGAEVSGTVSIGNAEISADLDLRGARVVGYANETGGLRDDGDLVANGVTVNGYVGLGPTERPCTVAGCVAFDGATIGIGMDLSLAQVGGFLTMDDATVGSTVLLRGTHLTGAGGTALSAQRTKVGGSITSIDGSVPFCADGSIYLYDASIGHDVCLIDAAVCGSVWLGNATVRGNLDLRGMHLTHKGVDRGELDARGISVGRSVFLARSEAQSFTSSGPVDFGGAVVAGDLGIIDAQLGGPLLLARTVISTGLFLRGTHVTGTDDKQCSVWAEGMRVASGISMRRSEETSEPFRATGSVHLRGIRVEGDLLMHHAEVGGPLVLADATVASSLDLLGAQLTGGDAEEPPRGTDRVPSLDAERIEVGGDLSFRGAPEKPFSAVGSIVLRGANIGGRLDLRDASKLVEIDLREGHCWRFAESNSAWPDLGGARLTGFQFQVLDGTVTATTRLEWVRRQGLEDHWSPEPYEQLASFYVRTGDELSAQRVTIEKHRDELEHLKLKPRKGSVRYRFWRRPFGWLLGFGYRRWVAGALVAGVVAFAALAFCFFDAKGAMVPDKPAAAAVPCGEAYPCFNAIVYGADIVLPIIDFGQDGAWRPNPRAPWGTAAEWTRWILIATGWIVSSLFLAAFTVLIQRD